MNEDQVDKKSNGTGLSVRPTPINPLSDGPVGKSSFGLLLVGCATIVVFFGLDTIQFVVTGHESTLFLAIGRLAVGGSSIGILGMLITSYLKRERKQ